MKLRMLISRHPIVFAVATLFICLAVYSAVAAANPPSPAIPPAAATIPAHFAYRISRPAFWTGAGRKRDARILALAAIGAAAVVAAIGIALGAFEPLASDTPLVADLEFDTQPAFFLLALIAVCAFTGIYEEAVFSAVLFGGLRIYYTDDGDGENIPTPENAGGCTNKTASAPESEADTDGATVPEDGAIRSLTHRMLGKAAAVQGVAFALAHIITALLASPQGTTTVMVGQMAAWFAATFLFGAITAVLMEYGRSLALNAAVHAVYDFALFGPLALKAGTMRSATVTGNPYDLVLFAAQGCLLAIILVALYVAIKRKEVHRT